MSCVEPEGGRDVTLIATGSEVEIALAAAELLARRTIRAAVVSVPCWELFDSSRATIAPRCSARAPRVGVEAAVEVDWARWLGDSGAFVGMTGFGASAPADGSIANSASPRRLSLTAALRCIARSRMAATYA